MYKRTTLAALFLSSTLCGTVHAEGGYYGGNFSFLDYSEQGVSDDASLTAIYGRLGTSFNENFSGELRIGLGMGDDSVAFDDLDVNVELDNMYGAYVRGGVPVSEAFFPYVVLGYTRGEVTASVSGFSSVSVSESDISFGFGSDISVSQNVSINLEYMNYLDKDGGEISGFAIGVAGKF
ncbi:MAG: porin family protein [Agarilytica sp.]